MNRRSFLSFLSVAPVAVPVVATGMAQGTSTFGYVDLPNAVGEMKAFTPPPPPSYARDLYRAGFITPNEARAFYGLSESDFAQCPTVAEQFESDLDLLHDDLPARVIATNDQQTQVSPEKSG